MIVCICKNINEADIKKLIDDGHTSIEQIQKQCGAGTDCTSCLQKIKELIKKE